MKKASPDLWFFIFLSGLLAFNWPFLAIAYKQAWLYLTIMWAVFIGLIALFSFTLKER